MLVSRHPYIEGRPWPFPYDFSGLIVTGKQLLEYDGPPLINLAASFNMDPNAVKPL